MKAKVLRGGSVNPTLRAWSQGLVGDKTFQQISEEFAELIIPKVWEREGRKISRVASRVPAMSPKKVRRILSRVGRRKPARLEVADGTAGLVPQRFSCLQRVLNPLLRLALSAERFESLALQIEHILFADRRSRRDVTSAKNLRRFCCPA